MFQSNSDPAVIAQRLADLGNKLDQHSRPQSAALEALVEELCVSESYDGVEKRFVFSKCCHLVWARETGDWKIVVPPIVP